MTLKQKEDYIEKQRQELINKTNELQNLNEEFKKEKETPPEAPKPKNKDVYSSSIPKQDKSIIPKKKSKWPWYVFPLLNNFIIFILWIVIIFIIKQVNIWTILLVVLSIPIGLLSWGIIIFRLFFDAPKIKQKALPFLTKNFIIANFWTNNKRLVKRMCMIDKDGMSFKIDDRVYIIDKEEIWYDEKNYPNSYYFPEIPNPIKLSADKVISKFMESVRHGDPNQSKDDEGNVVDLSFSSRNLQLFKKNKIFDELNQDPERNKTTNMIIAGLIGTVIFLIFVLLMSIILK